MLNITLYGNVPSKKNSKRIISQGGRPLIISSKSHNIWHEEAMHQLRPFYNLNITRANVDVIIYPKTKAKGDLSNKLESLMDVLVDANLIEDDNWYVIPNISVSFGGVDKNNPRAEISICQDLK